MEKKVVQMNLNRGREMYFTKFKTGDYVEGTMIDVTGSNRRVRGWVLSPTDDGVRVRLARVDGIGTAELIASLGTITKLVDPLEELRNKPNRALSQYLEESDWDLAEEITVTSGDIVSKLDNQMAKIRNGEVTPESVYAVYSDIISKLDGFLNDRAGKMPEGSLISAVKNLEEAMVGAVIQLKSKQRYLIINAVYSAHYEGVVELLGLPVDGKVVTGLHLLVDAVCLELSVQDLTGYLVDGEQYDVVWKKLDGLSEVSVHHCGREIGYAVVVSNL